MGRRKKIYYGVAAVLAVPAVLAMAVFISVINSPDQGGLFGLAVIGIGFIASVLFGGASLIFLVLAIIQKNQLGETLQLENHDKFRKPIGPLNVIWIGLAIILLSWLMTFIGFGGFSFSGFGLVGYPAGGIVLIIGLFEFLVIFFKKVRSRFNRE